MRDRFSHCSDVALAECRQWHSLLQLPRNTTTRRPRMIPLGHHAVRLSGACRSGQASSLRFDPFGARGLDRSSRAPRMGNCVMATKMAQTVRDASVVAVLEAFDTPKTRTA